jgi:hypothetical protein
VAQPIASSADASAPTIEEPSIIGPDGTVDTSQFTTFSVPYPKELTDGEMLQMSTEDLQKYADEVSTSIGLEYSTIYGYETMQGRVEQSMSLTQREIDTIDTNINSNMIVLQSSRARKEATDTRIRELDSTIVSYTGSISTLDTNIFSTSRYISSLTLEARMIDSTIAFADSTFLSAAIGYSSLFENYITKSTLYANRISDVLYESSILSTMIRAEAVALTSYRNASTARIQTDRNYTSTVIASNAQQNLLRNLQLAEQTAIDTYTSTMTGFITLSSLYTTSLATQQYYQLASTQTTKINQYSDALSTFILTERAYLLDQGNTFKANIYATASTVLNTITNEKVALDSALSTQQQLVEGTQAFSYEALISGYISTIRYESDLISTYTIYESTARVDAAKYNYDYNRAILNINNATNAYNSNSTLYKGYMNTISSLTNQLIPEMSTMESLAEQSTLTNVRIATLTNDISTFTSSFNGYKQISTIRLAQYTSSISNATKFSTLYKSTLDEITKFNNDLLKVESSIIGYTAIMNVNSSIVDKEAVNIQSYNIALADSIIAQEFATAQYFETYIRSKRLQKETTYNTAILNEIRNTSTVNGTAQMNAGPSTVVTIQPVNLTGAVIKNALTEFTDITAFLDSFSNVYNAYITQATNYAAATKLVADKQASLSTLQSLKNNLNLTDANIDIQGLYTASYADWVAKGAEYDTQMRFVSSAAIQINEIKPNFKTSLQRWLPNNEFTFAVSTISSFIIQGINSVV